ncbi:MAG: acetoacetate decarboxylase family protein [Gammaproteobacteria bacterium]
MTHRVIAAPWRLEGSGLILLLKPPRAEPDAHWYALPQSGEFAQRGFGLMMFVDYWRAEAGPYRELLFIPGRFQYGARRRWSITRILVSTPESVAGGRANWGIPKQQAEFDLAQPSEGRSSVRVETSDKQHLASFSWESRGPTLPVSTGLLPASLHTLIQDLDGQRFEFTPKASGGMSAARLHCIETNPALFPAISRTQVFAAFSVERFQMQFPVARITSPQVSAF